MENKPSERIVFFDGKNIAVMGILPFESEQLVINFSSRINSGKPVMTPAAEIYANEGERFFYKRQIPAIYFFARRNDWWQTEEVFEAIKILQESGILDKYKYITTYGLSMGAYGALIFSRALKATRVIAIAPQYSINSKVVPFETRWSDDRQRINFIYDDMDSGLIKDGQVIIFYDRFFDFDKRHVDLVSQHRSIDKFLVNFSTHTVARVLNDMGIFSQIMERLFDNKLTKKEFSDLVRSHRNQSPLLLHNMAHLVKKQGRPHIATVLYRRALDVMEERIKTRQDYYQKVELALASIRVIEGYVREQMTLKLLTPEIYARCEQLASFFKLSDYYVGWSLTKAQALLELGRAEEAQQVLDSIEKNIKPAELNKFLTMYLQVLTVRPCTEKILDLHQRYKDKAWANDTACLKLGGMLLLDNNLKTEAVPYFLKVIGEKKIKEVPLILRHAFIGLAKCKGLEDVYKLMDELLEDNKSDPTHSKIKNIIRRYSQ